MARARTLDGTGGGGKSALRRRGRHLAVLSRIRQQFLKISPSGWNDGAGRQLAYLSREVVEFAQPLLQRRVGRFLDLKIALRGRSGSRRRSGMRHGARGPARRPGHTLPPISHLTSPPSPPPPPVLPRRRGRLRRRGQGAAAAVGISAVWCLCARSAGAAPHRRGTGSRPAAAATPARPAWGWHQAPRRRRSVSLTAAV